MSKSILYEMCLAQKLYEKPLVQKKNQGWVFSDAKIDELKFTAEIDSHSECSNVVSFLFLVIVENRTFQGTQRTQQIESDEKLKKYFYVTFQCSIWIRIHNEYLGHVLIDN